MQQTSHPFHPSLRFYTALPRRKAELVNGQLLIGCSLAKSAMTLGYMVEHLGAAYVAEMVPRALLSEAVIEVFGKNKGLLPPIADFSAAEPYYHVPSKLANDLMLGLHIGNANAAGNTCAVRLGDDVFTPDIYLLKDTSAHRQQSLYLDGPPDLAIEVVTAATKDFDWCTRLQRYAQAGLPEVWLLDFQQRSFHPLTLKNGAYAPAPVEGEWFFAQTIPGFGVEHGKIFDTLDKRGLEPLQIFQIPESLLRKRRTSVADNDYPELPFAPRFDLHPVPIAFDEFISWGGEVKFEMMDGRPVFGGNEATTAEWLGMLMMTLGIAETVKYLPAADWSAVL